MEIFNSISNSQNPMQALMKLASSNPNLQTAVETINNCGGNVETAFYQLASQRGIEPNAFLNQIKSMISNFGTR